MFEIDKEPMEAAGLGDLWRLDRAQSAEIEAGSEFAFLQAPFDGICDDGHG